MQQTATCIYANMTKTHFHTNAVSERYANALLQVAQSSLPELEESAKHLFALLRQIPALLDLLRRFHFIHSPSKEEWLALAKALQLAPMMGNFLHVLCVKHRLMHLSHILQTFLIKVAEGRNEKTAYITVSSALSAKQIAHLEDILSQHFGKKMHLEVQIDPAIVQGMVLYYDSMRIDASLQTQLKQIQQQCLAALAHV